MGKICITNNEEWLNKIDEIYSKTGYEFSEKSSDSVIRVYKKLLGAGGESFSDGIYEIFLNGTLIYNGFTGRNALEKVLCDYKNKGIEYIQNNAIGSYVIAVKKENIVEIFIDKVGTYSFYYWKSADEFLLTNMFYTIEKCVKEMVNKMALLEWTVTFCILNNETLFENIFRIMPGEKVICNFSTGDCRIEELTYRLNPVSYLNQQDVIDKLSEEMNKCCLEKKQHYKENVVFVTGGLDSRIMVAVNVANGIIPRCEYWGGKSALENYNEDDVKIGEKIVETINSSYVYHDITDSFFDKFNCHETYYDLMGDYATLYGGNTRLKDIFSSYNQDTFVDFGYFGELLTPWEQLDNTWKPGFTLKDFVDEIYWNRYNCTASDLSCLKERIYAEFEVYAKRNGFNNNCLEKGECLRLYQYYRLRADTVMCNFSNMFCNHFMILGQPKIFELVESIPYELKNGSYISIQLTKTFDERLVEIPFYSHGHYKNLLETGVFEDKSVSDKKSFKEMIKEIILKVFGNKQGNRLLDVYSQSCFKKKDFLSIRWQEDQEIIKYCLKHYPQYKEYIDIQWLDARDCLISYVVAPYIMVYLIDKLYASFKE